MVRTVARISVWASRGKARLPAHHSSGPGSSEESV